MCVAMRQSRKASQNGNHQSLRANAASDATATCLPIFCSSFIFPQQKLVVVHLNPAILAMFWNVLALESVEGGVVGFWECVASLLIKVVTSFSPAQFVAE